LVTCRPVDTRILRFRLHHFGGLTHDTISYSSLVASFPHWEKASPPHRWVRILEGRGSKIAMVKLDPYINVDPGTMSPFQHGEVFVTNDGTETDLDLGHYERFVRTTTAATAISRPGASTNA
jgi:hypothetical protein